MGHDDDASTRCTGCKIPAERKPKIPSDEEYETFMEMGDALMTADAERE